MWLPVVTKDHSAMAFRRFGLTAVVYGGVGAALALTSVGCSGSSEPVMTEAAKEAERKAMADLTKANDAAANSAKTSSKAKVGVMPP